MYRKYERKIKFYFILKKSTLGPRHIRHFHPQYFDKKIFQKFIFSIIFLLAKVNSTKTSLSWLANETSG
jgi:hypothetical protein